jgi:hypothetical protein
MVIAVRRLVICLLFCVSVACWVASASEASALPGGESSSPLADPLVVPEEQIMDGGQQQMAAAEALRSSPEAVVAREESRTKSLAGKGSRLRRTSLFLASCVQLRSKSVGWRAKQKSPRNDVLTCWHLTSGTSRSRRRAGSVRHWWSTCPTGTGRCRR